MKRERASYAAGGTPAEVKDYRAQLAAALKRRGVPVQTFLEANNETDYSLSLSTLYSHIAAAEAGHSPLSAESGAGRPTKLTEEQWHVVAGAILTEAKKTDLQWVQTWVGDHLGIDLAYSTISRHLNDLDLCFRLTGGRPMPKSMTEIDYVSQYYECVLVLRNTGFFAYDPSKVIAVDCCTNSRRLERDKTITMIGAKQKKMSAGKPTYTNTYVVAVALEDTGQYPALMFTHDPTFDPNGRQVKEVDRWLKYMSISRDRVVYIPSKKSYCAESSDLIGHFHSVYRKELTGTRVLHDGGNSFKKGSEFILADGADRHFILPAATHGELSPLDNKVNAIAKNKWRTERQNEDFSYDDLYLLWCFDWVEPVAIKSCWTKNFLLNEKKMSLAATADQLKGDKFSRGEIQAKYIAAFEAWCEDEGQEVPRNAFVALESRLDGSYWTE